MPLIECGYSFPRPTALNHVYMVAGFAFARLYLSGMLHALKFYCIICDVEKEGTESLYVSHFCGLALWGMYYQREEMGEDDVQQGSPPRPLIILQSTLPKQTDPSDILLD